jgi:hypothetical protein
MPSETDDSRATILPAEPLRKRRAGATWESVVLLVAVVLAGGSAFEILAHYVPQFSRDDTPSVLLTATPSVYEFGQVSAGVHSAEFSLENSAEVPVQIVSVSKSCDCTDVRVPAEILLPGDTVSLECEWDLTGYDGAVDSHVTAFVRVLDSDDPSAESDSSNVPEADLKEMELHLNADVVPTWRIVPDRLTFSANETETQRVQVVPVGAQSISVLSIVCAHEAFDVSADPSSNELVITCDPEKWLIDGWIRVSVQTDCPISPTKRITLTVR